MFLKEIQIKMKKDTIYKIKHNKIKALNKINENN